MSPKGIAFVVLVILSPFLFWVTATAQDDREEASPLSITTQFSTDLGTTCNAGSGIIAQFHYSGPKPLRGYLAVFTLADSTTGKVVQRQSIQEIRDSHESMISTGGEWTRTVCSMPKKTTGDSVTAMAKVDVLDFADGSIWGPAALRESHQLIGTLNGIDFKGETTTELERYVSPLTLQHGPFPAEAVETQTIGPLKIESGIWHDEHGHDMFALAITNESSTAIRGYLLTTSFFDPSTGATIRRFSTKELETHGNPADYLAPGSTWVADPRKFSYLPDGTPASYKMGVDLVVFADGSTFGPKKSAESDEVLGMFRGIDAANPSSREASAH